MSATVHEGTSMPHPTGSITGSRSANGEVTSTRKYRVADELEAATYKLGEAHPTLGIPEDTRSWQELEPCELGVELTIVYKGKPDGEEDDYELDVSFSEEPIQAHPNWLAIKKRWRGRVTPEGDVEFPEFLLTGKKSGLSRGEKERVKNPMYGVKTYLALKAVHRHTFTSTNPPSLSRYGKVKKTVKGGFSTPEDHDWLELPPKARRRGSGEYQISIESILSPRGGYPETVNESLDGRGSPRSEDNDPLGMGGLSEPDSHLF